MLHNNVIEQKGFRTLDAAELDAVSGGVVSFTDGTAQTHNDKHLDDPSGFDAILGDPSSTVFLSWGGDGDQASYGTVSGSGAEEYQGEIVVTPNIENHGSYGDPFLVHMNADGTYVQFEAIQEFVTTGLFSGHWVTTGYEPIGHGTWSVSHSNGSVAVGIPAGVSYTFGGKTYTFSPEE